MIPASQQPALVIDASMPHVFVGIWRDGQWLATANPQVAALEGLALACEDCLQAAQLRLEDMQSFVHCEGPGSLLSLRIAAMTLRTWLSSPLLGQRPLYQYRSLPMLASTLSAPFDLIAPARRKLWWHLQSSDSPSALAEIESSAVEALTGNLYYLPQRKGWHKPPPQAQQIQYSPKDFAPLFAQEGILQKVSQPTIFPAEAPTYEKWTPERHR